MDLKIDFSELIDKIRELIRDSVPTCKVEVILEDGSVSFNDIEMKSTMIPIVGDVFEASCYRSYYSTDNLDVKVLRRKIIYYNSEIYRVILTVEKV